MNAVLQCRQVTKRYGRQLALDRLDLDVREGEIFGLLGPNGAGKTTLIRIILGLAAPSTGQISLFGDDLFTRRNALIRHVGAVVEAPMFFEYMSAWDNLRCLVSLNCRVADSRLREILHLVGLEDAARKRVSAFSYGMKQRLGIAQALLPQTRFLILDEPTNGLDPHGIAGIRGLIRRLAAELRITVFLSSHLLVEVERVCDRVAIIHHGRKMIEDTVSNLTARSLAVEVRTPAGQALPPSFGRFTPASVTPAAEAAETSMVFTIGRDDVPELVRELVAAGVPVRHVAERETSLESVFIAHTKGGATDARIDSIRD